MALYFKFNNPAILGEVPVSMVFADNSPLSESIAAVFDSTEEPTYVSFDGEGIDLMRGGYSFFQQGDATGILSAQTYDPGEFPVLTLNATGQGWLGDKITVQFYGNGVQEFTALGGDPATQVVEVVDGLGVITVDTSGTSVTLTDFKFTAPGSLLKIAAITSGGVNYVGEITAHEIVEEINPLSTDLPIGTLTFSGLMTPQDAVVLRQATWLEAWNNGSYYGTFHPRTVEQITGALTPDGVCLFDVTAENAIGTLQDVTFYGWRLENDLAGLLSDINRATGEVVAAPSGVDASKILLVGQVPIGPAREALCAAGWASAYMVDANRRDHIVMRPIPAAVSSTITEDDERIIGEATLAEKEKVSTANLHEVWFYAQDARRDYQVTLGAGDYMYPYPDPPCNNPTVPAGSGVTITDDTLANVVYLTATQRATVTLQAYPCKIVDTISALPVWSDAPAEKAENFDKINVSGYQDTYDAAPIQHGTDNADLLAFCKSRGTVSAKIVLGTERCGDRVTIQTAFLGNVTGIITKMVLHLGYNSTADVEVVEWAG